MKEITVETGHKVDTNEEVEAMMVKAVRTSRLPAHACKWNSFWKAAGVSYLELNLLMVQTGKCNLNLT